MLHSTLKGNYCVVTFRRDEALCLRWLQLRRLVRSPVLEYCPSLEIDDVKEVSGGPEAVVRAEESINKDGRSIGMEDRIQGKRTGSTRAYRTVS